MLSVRPSTTNDDDDDDVQKGAYQDKRRKKLDGENSRQQDDRRGTRWRGVGINRSCCGKYVNVIRSRITHHKFYQCNVKVYKKKKKKTKLIICFAEKWTGIKKQQDVQIRSIARRRHTSLNDDPLLCYCSTLVECLPRVLTTTSSILILTQVGGFLTMLNSLRATTSLSIRPVNC